MPTPSNSINESTTGITGFTGTAFTGTPATAHNVLIGGSTSSTITNVAPTSTTGIPLVSGGSSVDPSFTTASIAGGGTNATSMSTSNGIVKYDGTRLVTSTTATIDASNRYQNTSQVVFKALRTTAINNATGDNTQVTVTYDSVTQQGSSMNAGTGVFTAPVTGYYLFTASIFFLITSNSQQNYSNFLRNSNSEAYYIGPFPISQVGDTQFSNSLILMLNANDTLQVIAQINGSIKDVKIYGGTNASPVDYGTWFTGILLC